MSQVITGLYNVPFSAASAAYAPTNSSDVTALIDSAVSGKLDASASSSFVTSTADCMPLSASSNYATTSDLADKLDASASSSFQPVGNYVSSDELSAYQTVEGMSAYQSAGDYATTAQLAEKLDASASSSFVTSTADCMPLASSSEFYSTANPAGYITGVDLTPYAESSSLSAYQETSGMSAYQTVEGMSAYQPSGSYQTAGDYVSSSELADYQKTAAMSSYATTGDLAEKLDASASSSFITSTAGLATTSDLDNYQPTSSMSAYATTEDLSAKLDASASSSFVTSTSDCMPLSASSNYATTSQLADKLDASASSSFITSTAGLATTSDLADYLPTSSIGTDTAGITSIAGTAIAGGGGGGGGVVTATGTASINNNTITALTSVNDTPIEASYLIPGASIYSGYKLTFAPATSMWTTADYATGIFSPLQYGTGAGMFLRNNPFNGYLKGNEWFVSNENTGYVRGEIHGTRGCRVVAENKSGVSAELNAKGKTGAMLTLAHSGSSTAYLDNKQFYIKNSAKKYVVGMDGISSSGPKFYLYNTADSAYKYIYPTSIDYWNDKAESSSLADYQPTSSMSAYASTADLSAKLDASASSSFITSTADCMPLSASSNYASTADLSAKLDTSAIETSTAGITGIGGTSIAGGEQVVTSLQYTTGSATSDVGSLEGYTYGNFNRVVTATYLDSPSWETYTSGMYLHTVTAIGGGSQLYTYSAYPFNLYMLPEVATNDGYSDYQNTSTIAQILESIGLDLPSCCIASAMSYEGEGGYQCIDFNVTSCPLVERGSDYSWGEDGPFIVEGEEFAPVFMIESVGMGGMIDLYDVSTDFIFSAYTTSQLISGINELTLDYASTADVSSLTADVSSLTADVSSLSAEIGDINTLLQSI